LVPGRRLTNELHTPKYQQVIEILSNDIISGRYQAGQKLPSEAALVQQFRTSRITVGRALRELKIRGLIAGVAGSGTYVRGGARRDSALFGLLIPDLGETEIFEPICRGMAAAPGASRYGLLWGRSDPGAASKEDQALALCAQFIEQRVSGVFFAPLELSPRAGETNSAIVSLLENARIPIVLLDRDILRHPQRSRHDLAGIDNRRAGHIATAHLLNHVPGRIAFLGLRDAAPTVDARIAGYREALFSHRPEEVHLVDEVDSSSVQRILQPGRIEGFVCANDRIAARLLQALMRLNIRVPEDVKIAGIDDVEYAVLLPVPLTTVHQPCRAIGEAAIGVMLDRIARPDMLTRDVLLESRLIVRDSCGARMAGVVTSG
jgi:GntR family transcriptional regulator, arabinose operon transcriptional repressor